MKTAMQMMLNDLISKREVYENASMHQSVATIETSIELAEYLLEKEKEQIITDYSNGFLNALGYKKEDKNIEYGIIMQSKAEADIYYNETYNQNK
jgi:hypothetical protein